MKTVVRNWRDHADQLRAAQQKYAQSFAMMTPYEQAENSRMLSQARDALRGVIEGGVVYELDAAIGNFNAAQAGVERARRAEVNGYDASKLAAELAVVNARVDVALRSEDPVKALGLIVNEGAASGEKHRRRATDEIIQGVVDHEQAGALDGDTRVKLNRLSRAAARDLAELRDTPEFKNAVTQAEGAFDAMMGAHRQLTNMAELLGDLIPNTGGPYKGELYQAYKRILVDDDGSLMVDGVKV